MKRTSLAVTIILCGCGLSQSPLETNLQVDTTPKTPLEQYKQCMGLSDKSIVYTNENVGRYIVVISQPSATQNYLNKKEQGTVYRIGLLECDTGNTIKECQDQMWLHYVSIGSPTNLKVGSIKTFTNADLIYDDLSGKPFTETTKDGRFATYTNYCYINRINPSKTYCSNFINNSEWRSECKGKLTGIK